MTVIHDVVSTSAEMIKALGRRSEEIGSITSMITEIADQTGLLALNASIIAAQAGEHGRGFAVVADQVKELATRSSGAAKEIEGLIRSVQAESQKAVESMEKGRHAVENGVTLANRGGEALERILASVEVALASIANNTKIAHEQALMSEQVRKYMETVVEMVNEIARATGEQQQGAMQITEAVNNMRNLSEQVKRATTEQTRGTQHVLEAMESVTLRVQESSTRAHELAKFSADLAKETHTLTALLDQFNIGQQEQMLVKKTPEQELAPIPLDLEDLS
jgi:methyl-accepting chemotaxis protein